MTDLHRFRFIAFTLALLATAVFAAPAAGAGSAIDQYVESIPSADGKSKPTSGASADGTRAGDPFSAGAPSASDVGGFTRSDADGTASGDDASGVQAGGAGRSLTSEGVANAGTPGFVGAASSGLGGIGLLLGGLLVLALAATAMARRRGRLQ
jgi:hypothetical protein